MGTNAQTPSRVTPSYVISHCRIRYIVITPADSLCPCGPRGPPNGHEILHCILHSIRPFQPRHGVHRARRSLDVARAGGGRWQGTITGTLQRKYGGCGHDSGAGRGIGTHVGWGKKEGRRQGESPPGHWPGRVGRSGLACFPGPHSLALRGGLPHGGGCSSGRGLAGRLGVDVIGCGSDRYGGCGGHAVAYIKAS